MINRPVSHAPSVPALVAKALIALPLLTFIGCAICVDSTGYRVIGTVLDAATLQPLADAQVSVILLRNGEALGAGAPFRVPTNAFGVFEDFIVVDRAAGLCPSPPEFPPVELGDPPDEVRLIVQVGLTEETLLVPLSMESIEIFGLPGRPNSGNITIPPVPVPIGSP